MGWKNLTNLLKTADETMISFPNKAFVIPLVGTVETFVIRKRSIIE